jgi:histidinol-phosphate aminotransferase
MTAAASASSPPTGPVSRIDPERAYRRDTPAGATLLRLDVNEGPLPPRTLLAGLASADPDLLRRYPEVGALEAALAARLGVPLERVVVTAGADEAIDRACRAFLQPGRVLLVPEPCFDMFDRCGALAGGTLVRVPWWGDRFPLDGFLERLESRVAVVVVVSPNNPTGSVATLADVRSLAARVPNALLILDHVYVEYADVDLTAAVLDLPNVLVLRTFSKAWGLAGCRVGYAVGSPYLIGVLRAAGGPYSVAAPSVALALAQLERGGELLRAHVARVREERRLLAARLSAYGLSPRPSQANFLFVDCGLRAAVLRADLIAGGVVVRDFPDRPGLASALRITLPGNAPDFDRLCEALDVALAAQGFGR